MLWSFPTFSNLKPAFHTDIKWNDKKKGFALKKMTYKSTSAQTAEKNIKADWRLLLKESDVSSDLMCLHAEHYPIIIWMLN